LQFREKSSEIDETPAPTPFDGSAPSTSKGLTRQDSQSSVATTSSADGQATTKRGTKLDRFEKAAEQVKACLNLTSLPQPRQQRVTNLPEDTREMIPYEPAQLTEVNKTNPGKNYRDFQRVLLRDHPELFSHVFAISPEMILHHNIALRHYGTLLNPEGNWKERDRARAGRIDMTDLQYYALNWFIDENEKPGQTVIKLGFVPFQFREWCMEQGGEYAAQAKLSEEKESEELQIYLMTNAKERRRAREAKKRRMQQEGHGTGTTSAEVEAGEMIPTDAEAETPEMETAESVENVPAASEEAEMEAEPSGSRPLSTIDEAQVETPLADDAGASIDDEPDAPGGKELHIGPDDDDLLSDVVTSCSRLRVDPTTGELDENMNPRERRLKLALFRYLLGWDMVDTGIHSQHVAAMTEQVEGMSRSQVKARKAYKTFRGLSDYNELVSRGVCSKCLWVGHYAKDCNHTGDPAEQQSNVCTKCGCGIHDTEACPVETPCITCGKSGHHHLTCTDPLAVVVQKWARRCVTKSPVYCEPGSSQPSAEETEEAREFLMISDEGHWLFA